MAVREELLRNIRSVEPYVPGEQPQHKVVKLNTNENPYPPAPGVERVLKEMDTDRFRLYPDPTADELVGSLADYYGVGKDQVFVGVGSDVSAVVHKIICACGRPRFWNSTVCNT